MKKRKKDRKRKNIVCFIKDHIQLSSSSSYQGGFLDRYFGLGKSMNGNLGFMCFTLIMDTDVGMFSTCCFV